MKPIVPDTPEPGRLHSAEWLRPRRAPASAPARDVSLGRDCIPHGAVRTGWLPEGHPVHLTVILSHSLPLTEHHALAARAEIRPHSHLTQSELHHAHGPTADASLRVRVFARRHGLTLHPDLDDSRSILLSGSAAVVGGAFGVRFEQYLYKEHTFFVPDAIPRLPANWDGLVDTVLGLRTSPYARRNRTSFVHGRGTPARLHDLAEAYAFPRGLDGSGQTVALLEFGGGFHRSDINAFCDRMAIPRTLIDVIEVGQGRNQPAPSAAINEYLDAVSGELTLAAAAGDSQRIQNAIATVEVTMDIEIVAALAPAARIVVYFATPGEQGMYHAISRAVHDQTHCPGIISISWGIPEICLHDQTIQAIESVLHEAAHLGITVCASSGDDGAYNNSPDGQPTVNYPASSPLSLACGGTSGSLTRAQILEEVVWNSTHYGIKGATGGGVSRRFRRPSWQDRANIPPCPEGREGRGLPDVAGLADPRDGCQLLVAGRVCVSAGTSAVAPMWAALVARINQALGRRCGHLHPHIYHLGARGLRALRPIVKGHNDLYQAGEGWNACTGYGTPRGEALLAHLQEWLHGPNA